MTVWVHNRLVTKIIGNCYHWLWMSVDNDRVARLCYLARESSIKNQLPTLIGVHLVHHNYLHVCAHNIIIPYYPG